MPPLSTRNFNALSRAGPRPAKSSYFLPLDALYPHGRCLCCQNQLYAASILHCEIVGRSLVWLSEDKGGQSAFSNPAFSSATMHQFFALLSIAMAWGVHGGREDMVSRGSDAGEI
ncbi:hypothetical protein PM082_015168 [Marasmius tenuissimus]|nr:hypothetical protein PM082_015168 [Marasmius tenuissimus]